MIRPIVRYGADVLHQPAAPVTTITPEVEQLIDDMIQTMYAAPGVGLAATQVGVASRIFVADISVGRNPSDLLVFINPEFVERDGMQLEDEGCLSVPGFNATVARPSRAARSRTRSLTARPRSVTASWLPVYRNSMSRVTLPIRMTRLKLAMAVTLLGSGKQFQADRYAVSLPDPVSVHPAGWNPYSASSPIGMASRAAAFSFSILSISGTGSVFSPRATATSVSASRGSMRTERCRRIMS